MGELFAFRLKTADRPVCGLAHPVFADDLLPCHEPAGHEGRHCFDSDATEDGPGTLRLLFEAEMLEMAEHFDICDACGDRYGPLCFLGEMRIDRLLELGTAIKDRVRVR